MTQAELIVALKSVLCLIGLWFFIFFLWRDYCVDAFRERIFMLRDELFLVATRGEISFENPAYRMFRARLNVALRYAPEFTLTRLLLAMAFPTLGHSESAKWDENIKALPPETRAIFEKYQIMFVLNVLRFMVKRSFFLAVFILLSRTGIKTLATCNDIVKRHILPKASEGVERIESKAMEDDRFDDQIVAAST